MTKLHLTLVADNGIGLEIAAALVKVNNPVGKCPDLSRAVSPSCHPFQIE